MAKAGLTVHQVENMCHAELIAWFDDVLNSLGVPKKANKQDEGTLISLRRRDFKP